MNLENQTPRIEELWAMLDAGALNQKDFEAHMQHRQDVVYRSCGQQPPKARTYTPLNDHVLS